MCWPAPLHAGGAAPRESRQREQAGAEIGHRHAGFGGRAAGLAGHRHDPRYALRDQIEAAFAAGRPGLAVAGDRRVDQAAVRGCQRLVAEAERVHDAWTIVLDYDV